jgi:hypothetical protein
MKRPFNVRNDTENIEKKFRTSSNETEGELKDEIFQVSSPLVKGNDVEGSMVSATRIHSVIMNDHISEWLRLYGDNVAKPSPMLEFLMTKGHTFEYNINQILKRENNSSLEEKENQINTISADGKYDQKQVDQTIEAMKKGIPIISSAPLQNPDLQIYGVADLLVRSDFINKLFPEFKCDLSDQGCLFSKDWHYIVIDIKFSTLPLRADGVHILNQGHYKAYKSQLYIYNMALGYLQGYTPRKAFILGRKYKYTSRGQVFSGNCAFDRLGCIDYSGVDRDVPSQTSEAIKWIRSLRETGRDWTLTDHPELYPNMKYESMFQTSKKVLSEKLNEITQIWYCGVNQREIALSKGVSSWRDPSFSADLVEIKGQRGSTLNQILKVNRTSIDILPLKLRRMTAFLKKGYVNEFFVDFETLGGMFDEFNSLPIAQCQNMIFMITVGWVNFDKENKEIYYHKTFTAENMQAESERKIMDQFLSLIGHDSELFHWSDAEPNEWLSALKRHNMNQKDFLKDRWTDLHYIFREEPITVKGALNYSLKSVAKAMLKLGYISEGWTLECQDGMTAMLKAYQAYQNNNLSSLKEIEEYNQIDTKILWQIVTFLRNTLL